MERILEPSSIYFVNPIFSIFRTDGDGMRCSTPQDLFIETAVDIGRDIISA